MKNVTFFVLLFSSLILFTPTKSKAQFKMSIGPATGLNFNLHTGSDLSESGSGFGFFLNGQADMNFTPNIGLLATIGFYDNRSGSYSNTFTSSGTTYTDDIGVSLAYFIIEPLFKYQINRNFYVVGGPSLGFNIESSYDIERTGGGQTQTAKGSLKDMLVRFQLTVGGGYNIPINSLIDIAPYFIFGYGLTNVQDNVSWKVLTFQFGGAVKFRVI